MPLRLPSFEFFYVWLLVAACRGRGYRQSESNARLKICLVFLLSCSSLVPQYLATSGTNDETRERRRRRKRSPTRRLPTIKSLFTFPLLVRGYSWHRGSVEPRPPSNHEHMPLFGAVKPRVLQPSFLHGLYPMVTNDHSLRFLFWFLWLSLAPWLSGS